MHRQAQSNERRFVTVPTTRDRAFVGFGVLSLEGDMQGLEL